MCLRGKGRVLFLLFAATALFATSVASQTLEKGEISGTVFDPSGAVVPNATVKIIHVATRSEERRVGKECRL